MKRKLDAQQITRKLNLHVFCASIMARAFLRFFLKKPTCEAFVLARSFAGGSCLNRCRAARLPSAASQSA